MIARTSSPSGLLPQSQHIKQFKTNQEHWGKGTDDHILPLGISFFLSLLLEQVQLQNVEERRVALKCCKDEYHIHIYFPIPFCSQAVEQQNRVLKRLISSVSYMTPFNFKMVVTLFMVMLNFICRCD